MPDTLAVRSVAAAILNASMPMVSGLRTRAVHPAGKGTVGFSSDHTRISVPVAWLYKPKWGTPERKRNGRPLSRRGARLFIARSVELLRLLLLFCSSLLLRSHGLLLRGLLGG